MSEKNQRRESFVDKELTGNEIVDVRFSGSSVGDKFGRGTTIGGQDLNSLANYFGKGASAYDVDSITFERVHIDKVNKFIEQRRANFLKNSGFLKSQAIRYFNDALRATIINVRNISRQKIEATTPNQNRTQTPEVLPLDGKVDIWISGPALGDGKRIGQLENFASDLVYRLGAKSCTDPNPKGFMIQGADAGLLPKLESDLTYYDNLNLGEDLQLKISKKLEFQQGSPDEGRKPTKFTKCQKSGKTWRMFQ
ncbi:MAG: hypothetical protein WCV72_01570 [Patescibacteria group bacterium]